MNRKQNPKPGNLRKETDNHPSDRYHPYHWENEWGLTKRTDYKWIKKYIIRGERRKKPGESRSKRNNFERQRIYYEEF